MPAKIFIESCPSPPSPPACSSPLRPPTPPARTKGKTVTAKIALGDKRPVKARTAKVRAKKAGRRSVREHDVHARRREPRGRPRRDPVPAQPDPRRERPAALQGQHEAAQGRRSATLTTWSASGYFDHTSPNGDTFVDRILSAGYAKRNDGWTLGENLAWGTGDLSTPAGVMNAWMNSAGHKANILKKAYREVGIGIRLGVPTDSGVGATITADFGVKL